LLLNATGEWLSDDGREGFRAALSWGTAASKCAQLVRCIVYKPDGKRAVMIETRRSE
jgi:hypothetical protein